MEKNFLSLMLVNITSTIRKKSLEIYKNQFLKNTLNIKYIIKIY